MITVPIRSHALPRTRVLRNMFGQFAIPVKNSKIASTMPEKSAEYDQRWEGHWNGDGKGLAEGALWDASKSSPALDAVLASGKCGDITKNTRAFVPGCGRGYDLVTFIKAGVQEAVGLDLAPSAIPVANAYVKGEVGPALADAVNVVQGNFFTYTDPTGVGFDIGYDYTFFCALMPDMRSDWAPAWRRILRPGGKLITLIFPVDESLPFEGPPWPVTPELYKELLDGKNGFVLVSMEKVPDEQSHSQRSGKEWMAVWERRDEDEDESGGVANL